MYREWLAIERYRIEVMEKWPDSPRKAAGLKAARASLAKLLANAPADPNTR